MSVVILAIGLASFLAPLIDALLKCGLDEDLLDRWIFDMPLHKMIRARALMLSGSWLIIASRMVP